MFDSCLKLMQDPKTLSLPKYTQKPPWKAYSNGFFIDLHNLAGKYENDQIVDWGIEALNVDKVWKKTKGKGINVAVLDTGIANEHEDLSGACIAYRNFTTRDKLDVSDYVGHGTHCAGIIRAKDNNTGVIGVAPKCNLIVGKVLDDYGRGRVSWIADGIKWAVDEGAHIISMSLGGPTPTSRMAEAVQYALKNNVLIVAAAGNSGEGEDTVGFPGAYPDVVTVGAINSHLKRSSFSSTGPTLEIVAPGEEILSTFPGNKYATLSGTSMACPFIAGVAALIASYRVYKEDYSCSVDFLTNALITCASDIENPGFDNNTGWGIVNPNKSINFKGKRWN